MQRTMMKSKIHRATVTAAELHYEGSLTIDADLLDAADILPNEQVHVWDVTNGTRLVTYALRGEPGSGTIQVNGAGDEYGPSSTVFDGDTSEVIRLSHDLEPVVGIGVVDGRVTVDAQEVADYERYLKLRAAVLLWPAMVTATG